MPNKITARNATTPVIFPFTATRSVCASACTSCSTEIRDNLILFIIADNTNSAKKKMQVTVIDGR